MPDNSYPNVLTINADGTVSADFSGHVHAAGVDLDAGSSLTPPDTDRVRWLRTADGAAVASLYALELANGRRQAKLLTTNTGGAASGIELNAYASPAGFADAYVNINNEGGSGPHFKLLDSNDASGLVRVASPGFPGSTGEGKVFEHGPFTATIPNTGPQGSGTVDIPVDLNCLAGSWDVFGYIRGTAVFSWGCTATDNSTLQVSYLNGSTTLTRAATFRCWVRADR